MARRLGRKLSLGGRAVKEGAQSVQRGRGWRRAQHGQCWLRILLQGVGLFAFRKWNPFSLFHIPPIHTY